MDLVKVEQQAMQVQGMPAAFNMAWFDWFVQQSDRTAQTKHTYKNNLAQFAAWIGSNGLDRLTRQDIIIYGQWLQENRKPNTVKQYLQTVKQFFIWAAGCGLYPNIAANVHAPRVNDAHKKDSLQPAEVQQIESSITERAAQKVAAAAEARKDIHGRIDRATEQGKRLFAMFLLAVNAGLRTIEISRANIKDLETKNGKTCIYIWGKGHAEADQKKPIAPQVKEAIDEYLASRTDRLTGNAPLFVSTGNRSRGQRIAATTISTMLKKAMRAAGFDSERITAHSLRHTTGQNIMQITGSNIYKTQLYMRHQNPKTTEIYLDNQTEQQNDILARQLYDHLHGIHGEDSAAELLQRTIAAMTPEQIKKLSEIATAIVNQ